MDNDGDHTLLTKSSNVALEVGIHSIAVRYYQVGGDMGLKLEYQGPGIEKQPVPADVPFHDIKGENIADTEE